MEYLNPDCQWLIWRFYFSENCVPELVWAKCLDCVRMVKPGRTLCGHCNLRRQGFSDIFSMLYSGWGQQSSSGST